MRGQSGFFDVDDRLKELSAKGDDLERLNAIVDFEIFRPDLARAHSDDRDHSFRRIATTYSDRSRPVWRGV